MLELIDEDNMLLDKLYKTFIDNKIESIPVRFREYIKSK